MARTIKQPRSIELLLTRTVEGLGIVGDLVKVKPGYARNYLVPLGLAQPPTPTKIESLKEQRATALSELNALRQAREELLERMVEVSIEMVRSCNDQGALYGSVSQRDIADALQEAGYNVGVRSIRLAHPYRRVGTYEVPVQFDKDLRTDVTLVIEPDHALEEIEEEKPQEQQQERRPREHDPFYGGGVDALETE